MAGQRIFNSLRLLYLAKVAERVEQAARYQSDVTQLLPILHKLNDEVTSTRQLEYGNLQLSGLFEELSQDHSNQSVIESLQTQMHRSCKLIMDVRSALEAYEYPFDHAKAHISVGEFALAALPDSENPGQIYEAAGSLIESTVQLRARLSGRLCQIAEEIESVLGLKPLPEPADAEETEEVSTES
jgi:hypothetical protein